MKKIIFLLVFVFMIALVGSASWTSNLDTDLRLYYEFEEGTGTSVVDLSSFSNNGTLHNGANWESGIVGTYASNYSATNDITNSSSKLGINGTAKRTINFWAKSRVTSDSTMIDTGNSSSLGAFRIVIRNDGGAKWQVIYGGGALLDTGKTVDTSNNMHTVIYNGTGTRYYLNGDLEGQETRAIATGESVISIGANADLTNDFNGIIDEVGVWNRSLTESEITQLYNGGSGLGYGSSSNITEIASAYPSTTTETATATFQTNVSIDGGNTISSVDLIYDSVSRGGTSSLITGSNYSLTKTMDIPVGSTGTVSFSWNVTLNNGESQTVTNSHTVNPLAFGICNTTLNNSYLNFSFKDESTLAILNATIPSATFSYYAGAGNVVKNLTFSNTTANYNYDFCASPASTTLNVNPYVQYASTGYPQRLFDPAVGSYTNSTTNKLLYLLASADGIYVTFQVINAAEQALANVAVNASRTISGAYTLLGSGYTGSDGGITFWLNPDFPHTFDFTLAQYPFYSTSLTPTQTSYTVTLGSVASSNATDYTKGISYSVKPISTYLSNGTAYNFNLTISSSYWSFDSYGFNLTNEDGVLLAANSGSVSGGGTIGADINTGDNETIIMTYYWIVNGTESSAVRYWTILDLGDSSFSLSNLVSRFNTYVTSGLFGLTSFGVGIICFVLILTVTGTVKLKYGVANDAIIAGIIFSLVALLDISFGLIPNPVGAIPNFPTVVMGFIFAGFLFKEVLR